MRNGNEGEWSQGIYSCRFLLSTEKSCISSGIPRYKVLPFSDLVIIALHSIFQAKGWKWFYWCWDPLLFLRFPYIFAYTFINILCFKLNLNNPVWIHRVSPGCCTSKFISCHTLHPLKTDELFIIAMVTHRTHFVMIEYWVWIPTLLLSPMTLIKLLNLCQPWYPHL